jgi:hypothetical protein
LGEFVEENKLKKAGGVEETERLRMARDEKIRKDVWERKRQMEEDQARAEAEGSDDDDDDDDDSGGDEAETNGA